MSNISVAEILKMHGDWIRAKDFVQLVSEKLRISDRQAYTKIKQDKEILKIVLPDRSVLYGLAEFGLPKSEVKNYQKLDMVKTALEHGIITKDDLELVSNIDFFLQNPWLLGKYKKEFESIKPFLKLIKEYHLQKIKTLENIEESSE